ncbi:hypothetical protein Dsin_029482 [Dipteronia sinensis]|uniref:RNase H type-1 domain-containing protein n=1 Tax=Dipteronia sinensis TaxID=43782 RepID=A0AAD9ZU56_9ROSI|nr:hypothetical protein Dsin_029482 [Dipteronia sinensis]
MVVEGLSSLLRKAHDLDMIRGISFGNTEVHISHLQFTDGTMLFLKPNMDYLLNAKRILRCFELASGLKINFHKYCVVRIGDKVVNGEEWAAGFKCKKGSLSITYLGLPLGARPCALSFWNSLIHCIEGCLARWKRKFLNKRGHLVLIKSVLASLPNYFLSIFKVPVGVAKTIKKLQRSFFWEDGAEKRKTHLVSWENICLSKKSGGLGVGRVLDKNKSLLAKWLWRFGREETTLWTRVICAKYGVKATSLWWDWSCNSRSSFFVRAVHSLMDSDSKSAEVIKEGILMIMGNVEARPRKCRVSEVWCPPSYGVFKFNVDGSVRGSLGMAGMGGVLRDSAGKVVCLFSIFLGIQDVNAIEIMAIGKACELISTDSNFVGRPIFIISDSKVAVSWVNNEVFGNVQHIDLIYDIRSRLKSLGNTVCNL